MSILYKTTFDRIVKVDKEKIEEKDGNQVRIIEKVESKIPVNLIINEPTRKQNEEGAEFYAIELNRLISKGILTREMLRKKMLDVNGSFLTNDETKDYIDILKRKQELEIDYHRINLIKEDDRTKEDKDSLDKISKEWSEIQTKIRNLEQSLESIFNQCAEPLAENRTLTWFTLQLPQVEENGKTKPLFEGKSFEEKLESYDKIVENNDSFMNQVISRATLVITLWKNNLGATQEQFDELISKVKL